MLGANRRFTLIMAAGSVAGAMLGGLLLGVFSDLVLIPVLALILLVSAVKLARPRLSLRTGKLWNPGMGAS
ncbi:MULTISPECIES: hypothetical protein [unclassified Streptomyces]|uniref:hypothetical protein n=1 Tax=unclassified Streptomyces TaxID=2593676 RepID=UPI001F1B193A|nr:MULTISPECIES: hypothetical protein [unclassified Streptomyces]